ncbi:MAG: hypothetical protein M3O34_01450 [Chloroflexota bacterium]|nr:hypothetical protein [Chloroflexota bacterium]
MRGVEQEPNPNAPTERQGIPRGPDRRHYAERLTRRSQRHMAENTVIMPWVDVAADLGAIRAGLARRDGNRFVVNRRTYVLKPGGRLYPVEGAGLHRLSRGPYRALALYNDPELRMDPERMLDLEGVSEEDREVARRLKRAIDEWRLAR